MFIWGFMVVLLNGKPSFIIAVSNLKSYVKNKKVSQKHFLL